MWGRQAEYAWAMPSTPAEDDLDQPGASGLLASSCCWQGAYFVLPQNAPAVASMALKQSALKGRAKVVV